MRFSKIVFKRNSLGFFEFASNVNGPDSEICEVEYETTYFKNKFVVEYIKYLK